MGIPKVNIQKITEETAIDAQGRPQAYVRVQYMVDEHGPFFERFAKDTFDPNAAKLALEAFARGLSTLRGM